MSIHLKTSLCKGLPLLICDYELGSDVTPMPSFSSLYVHNTYKHTNLDNLLTYSKQRGLAGIGYHFAINSEGTIFQTRPINIQGAHIYGKNQNSVGVVFLNIDQCVNSNASHRAFQNLVATLASNARGPLTIHSHTYGQFDHLATLTAQYNAELSPVQHPLLCLPAFDESVCQDETFNQKVKQMNEALHQHLSTQPPSSPLLSAIREYTMLLKICPGRHFLTFKQLL
mgnify:CR=1 FL=1